jgi:hypothetical protein
MLYTAIDLEDNKCLNHVCKNCNYQEKTKKEGHSLPIITNRYENNASISPLDDQCIMQTNYFDDNPAFKKYQTPMIKYDKTLPRLNNIKCPNQKCTKSKDQDNEVICIRYDHNKLKYLYFCCHCEHFWKLD